jgi:hypothetical protein
MTEVGLRVRDQANRHFTVTTVTRKIPGLVLACPISRTEISDQIELSVLRGRCSLSFVSRASFNADTRAIFCCIDALASSASAAAADGDIFTYVNRST